MRPIPDFPGYYINLKGEVWSDWCGRFLTIGRHKQGYKEVTLFRNRKEYCITIARLLLITFVRFPLLGEVARHLNDINTDDSLENLAWGTQKQNIQDMIRNGHQPVGDNHKNSKLFPLDVINILTLCQRRKYTQIQIAEMYGICAGGVSSIKHGKLWKHVYTVWKGL